MTDSQAGELLPRWEKFEQDYIETGTPVQLVVRSVPLLTVFADDSAGRMGARFGLSSTQAVPVDALDHISLAEVRVGGERTMEVSTSSRTLFRAFYVFIGDVISQVILGLSPADAFTNAVRQWKAMLAAPGTLSDTRQVGLFGELWLLSRLIPIVGAVRAVEAWTGPRGQAHDFRLGRREFEVKTSLSADRNHVINGLHQLEPSTDCRLFLLSILAADGGAGGETLPQIIERVSQELNHNAALVSYGELLKRVGYSPDDNRLYNRRLRLRSEPFLIPVIDGFPRLVGDALNHVPAGFAPSRISDLRYRVDVTNMGSENGTADFETILTSFEFGSAS